MSELREKFEDWFKRFNNCDDKLSADFGYQTGYAQAMKEIKDKIICPNCNGDGWIIDEEGQCNCEDCYGTGIIPRPKKGSE